ncbi:hypothetical protein RJ640_025873 [Escallonia rubra]|uniref:S-protein homolog n=1 Tax=Escallonia rubra TaxID=112253 RepID=A0AA88QCM3_9ASTE|nr:hypothetical protein RJ640_025873 [Escallonia rubra]
MATALCSSLMLTLAFYFFTISSLARNQDVEPFVHIRSAMNANSLPVHVNCKVNGSTVNVYELHGGEHYEWNARGNGTYYCSAIWGRWFASWHAFEPGWGTDHAAIFWMVNKDGFFLRQEEGEQRKGELWSGILERLQKQD